MRPVNLGLNIITKQIRIVGVHFHIHDHSQDLVKLPSEREAVKRENKFSQMKMHGNVGLGVGSKV